MGKAVKYYLDSTNPTVAGWAYDETNLDAIPIIDIFLDGELVLTINADLRREDLDAEIGSYCRGFSADLYDLVKEKKRYSLSIFIRSPVYISLGEFEIFGISKAEIGKDGWLFLRNDSNETRQKLESESNINDQNIQITANIIIERNNFLDSLSIKNFSLLIPDKSVLYNHHRLNLYNISDRREAMVLVDYLKLRGVDNFCYLIYELQESKNNVFYKTDTHLNIWGYLVLIEKLQKCNFISVPEGWINNLKVVKQFDFRGDLGIQFQDSFNEVITTIDPSVYNCVKFDDPIPRLLADRNRLTGSTVKVFNDSAPNGKLFLLGTSSAYYSLRVLSLIFREIYFQWGNIEDKEKVMEFSPTFFLWIGIERFLPLKYQEYF